MSNLWQTGVFADWDRSKGDSGAGIDYFPIQLGK